MKKKISQTATIQSQQYILRDFSSIINPVKLFFKRMRANITDTNPLSSTTTKNKNKMKKIIPLALLVIIIGGVLILTGRAIVASGKKIDSRADISGPTATMTLNKEFSFPILDSKGKEVTRLKYTIQDAQLRNEIVVKGSRATAIQGRTFLILSIKIVNEYNKGIDINARDYIRLIVNGNENELLAADIHNDPVSVQPISTKVTRLGFPINDTDTNLVLKVGEIKGNKESVTLSF